MKKYFKGWKSLRNSDLDHHGTSKPSLKGNTHCMLCSLIHLKLLHHPLLHHIMHYPLMFQINPIAAGMV